MSEASSLYEHTHTKPEALVSFLSTDHDPLPDRSPVLRLRPQVLKDVGNGGAHVELEVEGALPLRVLDIVVQPNQHGSEVLHHKGVAVEQRS